MAAAGSSDGADAAGGANVKGVGQTLMGILVLFVAIAIVALLVKNASGTATAATGFGKAFAGSLQAAEGSSVTVL